MKNNFQINTQLIKDTHHLVCKDGFHLLLHKNATIPWLIIVPETKVVEVFDLSSEMQSTLNNLTKQLADYFKEKYAVEKINIAAIGNIVSQLHIHVIGRKIGDACWPDVVWGNDYIFTKYSNRQLEIMKRNLNAL